MGENQPQVVIVKGTKSVGVSILLTFLFGPLGMFYSTILGALIMLVVSGVVGVMTLGVGLFLTQPICIIWGAVAAKSYNGQLLASKDRGPRPVADKPDANDKQIESDAQRGPTALHGRNDIGDYVCPACRLKTLLNGASRCPCCQKDIEPSFWEKVRQEEEIERVRQERERAEQDARDAVWRIEEEKRVAERAILEEKQRIRNLRILRVVVVSAGILGLLWLCTNEILLMVHRHEFKKAISHKQIDRARASACKLGERYYTTGDLDALQNFLEQRTAFETLLNGARELLAKYGGDEWNTLQAKVRDAELPGSPTLSAQAYNDAAKLVRGMQVKLADMVASRTAFESLLDGQRELLVKYGGDEWNIVQAKISEAEQPGSLSVSAQAYREAAKLVHQVQKKLAGMLTVQAAFSKDWRENSDSLKQFEPAVYSKLVEGMEHVNTLSNPIAACDSWKTLSSDLAMAKQGLSAISVAKAQYEAAKKTIGDELLKKYGKTDWQKAQQAVSQAEKADSINGAIALWTQAEESVNAEWNAMRTRQSQIKLECNAPGFTVFIIHPQSKFRSPASSSMLSLTPFVEHRIEIRAKGFKPAQLTLKLDEPGVDYGTKRVALVRFTEDEVRQQRAATLESSTVQEPYGPKFLNQVCYKSRFTMSGVTDAQAFSALREWKKAARQSDPIWDDFKMKHLEWSWQNVFLKVDISQVSGGDGIQILVQTRASTGQIPSRGAAIAEAEAICSVLETDGGTLEVSTASSVYTAGGLPANWKGMCTQNGYGSYPMLLRIDGQNGPNISGVICWPGTPSNCKTKFRGQIENGRLIFTEYELIQGKDAVVPTEYEAVINGAVMEGTYSTKLKTGVVTGPFRLEQFVDSEHPSDSSSVNNSTGQSQFKSTAENLGFKLKIGGKPVIGGE